MSKQIEEIKEITEEIMNIIKKKPELALSIASSVFIQTVVSVISSIKDYDREQIFEMDEEVRVISDSLKNIINYAFRVHDIESILVKQLITELKD